MPKHPGKKTKNIKVARVGTNGSRPTKKRTKANIKKIKKAKA